MGDTVKLPQRCENTVLLNNQNLLTCVCKGKWEFVEGKRLWSTNRSITFRENLVYDDHQAQQTSIFNDTDQTVWYDPRDNGTDALNPKYNINQCTPGSYGKANFFSSEILTSLPYNNISISGVYTLDKYPLTSFKLEEDDPYSSYFKIYVDFDLGDYEDLTGDGTKENPYNTIPSYISCYIYEYPLDEYSLSGVLFCCKGQINSEHSLVCKALSVLYYNNNNGVLTAREYKNTWLDLEQCTYSTNRLSLRYAYRANFKGKRVSADCIAESDITCEVYLVSGFTHKSKVTVTAPDDQFAIVGGMFQDCEELVFDNKYAMYYSTDLSYPSPSIPYVSKLHSLHFFSCHNVKIYGGAVHMADSEISSVIPPSILYLEPYTTNIVKRRTDTDINYKGYVSTHICILDPDQSNFWSTFFQEFAEWFEYIQISGFLYRQKVEFPDKILTGRGGFDKAFVDTSISYDNFGFITPEGVALLNNIPIELPAICTASIYFLHCDITYNTNISADYIHSDASTITFNNIKSNQSSTRYDISFQGYYDYTTDSGDIRTRSFTWTVTSLAMPIIIGSDNKITINQITYIGVGSTSFHGNFMISYEGLTYKEPATKKGEDGSMIDDTSDITIDDAYWGTYDSVYYATTINNQITLNLTLKDYAEYAEGSKSYLSKIPQPFRFYNLDRYNIWKINITAESPNIETPIFDNLNTAGGGSVPDGALLDTILQLRSSCYTCKKDLSEGQNYYSTCEDAPKSV